MEKKAQPPKKGGLGKGLSALIKDSSQEKEDVREQKTSNEVILIDINKIAPNPHQPRKRFDDDKIQELADSIQQHGVIQPITVRSIENGYEIIAGERRWRASRRAGLKEVPCLIENYTEQDNLLVALIENLQREDLNPMEESIAYQHMISNYSFTQDGIAKNVGKSRPYVANILRLQKLPKIIQEMISSGELSAGHARTLLALEDAALQISLAEKIVKDGLSVRQVETLIKEKTEEKQEKNPEKSEKTKHSIFQEIESDIKDIIGTKVKIKEKNNKGTIQLSFYSKDELERLIELLKSLQG